MNIKPDLELWLDPANCFIGGSGETPLLKTFMGEGTPDEAAMVTGIAMEVDGGRCM